MNTAWFSIILVIVQAVIASPSLATLIRAIRGRQKEMAEVEVASARAETLDAQASEAVARASSLMLGSLNAQLATALDKIAGLERWKAETEAAHQREREEWARQLHERDLERDKMNNKINSLRGGIIVLVAQLKRLGYTPEWQPTEEAP